MIYGLIQFLRCIWILNRYVTGSVQGSSYGKLSNDSSNVVQLVTQQYQAITSSIEMKVSK